MVGRVRRKAISSLANIRNQEMYVGDFDVGYHGASCHGLAWSCTRKIGKAEALVVVLHQDTQGQSDASPTCPHSSMSSYTPPCAYQPLPLARVFRVLGFLRYVSSYFRISRQPKMQSKSTCYLAIMSLCPRLHTTWSTEGHTWPIHPCPHS